ncbi:MAG: 3-deoxy-manno-octulosonate cytidylyltransferase [Thermodesulfobacteriota bacterium]
MNAIVIIPARYGSTRLAGKPLANISGRPMVQWVYEAATRTRLTDDVIIAADDERITEAVRSFGGKAILTSRDHRSGTDRVAEAAMNLKADIIVNLQGDEPLIRSEAIDDVIQPLLDDCSILISTLKKKIGDRSELENPNVVKVVTDKDDFALYFSRYPIPYTGEGSYGSEGIVRYKHIGLYAYRRDFLFKYSKMTPTPLERAERLEQLRALENGYRIKVVETDFDAIAVDTVEDLEKVRKIVESRQDTVDSR